MHDSDLSATTPWTGELVASIDIGRSLYIADQESHAEWHVKEKGREMRKGTKKREEFRLKFS